MSRMSTLHEIGIKYANKQPGMVDALTEDAPILRVCPWIAASHGLWHNAEVLTDVDGPAFVEMDAPLPMISTSSDLVRTDLHKMGGQMEVSSDKAAKFGGPAKYFADRQDAVLRKSGMDTERILVLQNWLRAAIRAHAETGQNIISAGAKSGWPIIAVRFDENSNVGLYDPDQFEKGRLFKISMPYNGAEHVLHGPRYNGILGYAITYRSHFGWQILNPKQTCAAIVGIDENTTTKQLTAMMVDDLLAQVRAVPGKTYLFTSPRGKIYGLDPHKMQNIHLVNTDKDLRTQVETWNGIPIIASYNITEKLQGVGV